MKELEYEKEIHEILHPVEKEKKTAIPCNNTVVKGQKKKVTMTVSESEVIE